MKHECVQIPWLVMRPTYEAPCSQFIGTSLAAAQISAATWSAPLHTEQMQLLSLPKHLQPQLSSRLLNGSSTTSPAAGLTHNEWKRLKKAEKAKKTESLRRGFHQSPHEEPQYRSSDGRAEWNLFLYDKRKTPSCTLCISSSFPPCSL